MGNECLLCQKIRCDAQRVEDTIFHREENAVAFLSEQPTLPGHFIIAPRKHGVAQELPGKVFQQLWLVGERARNRVIEMTESGELRTWYEARLRVARHEETKTRLRRALAILRHTRGGEAKCWAVSAVNDSAGHAYQSHLLYRKGETPPGWTQIDLQI